MVLRLVLHKMVNVHTLGNNTVTTVSRLLDAGVHVCILGRKNKKHDLGSELASIAHRKEKVLNRLASIRNVLMDYWSSVVDVTAMATVDLDKVSDKCLHRLQRCSVQPLVRPLK